MSIFTPSNQIRLSNVAYVRYKRHGIRFEIACFKNKVQDWRRHLETDISNVLQIENVFTNVSKGLVAKKADLIKCFGTDDKHEICLRILEQGELQVSGKERQIDHDAKLREIATIISERTINPEDNEPYSPNVILKSLQDVTFSLNLQQSSKVQAIGLIKSLKDILPLREVEIVVRVTLPGKEGKQLKEKIIKPYMKIESESYLTNLVMTGICAPGNYKKMQELIRTETKSKGSIQVSLIKDIKTSVESEN